MSGGKGHRETVQAIENEITRWAGVNATWEHGTKHPRVVLAYGDKSRFITLSGTCTDRRAVLNKLTDLKRELRTLGAVRA